MGEFTDFNDLHNAAGLDAVGEQLDAALADFRPVEAAPSALAENELLPPDYLGDVPDAATDSPPPSDVERPGIDALLRRYALLMPDGKIWDSFNRQIIKKTAFKDLVGAARYKEWVNDDGRRTVDKSVTFEKKLSAAEDGGRGLIGALNRYTYVSPSDFVWDGQILEVVPISQLRYAIADCFDDWLKHPNRKEIPRANFVFDPTQKVDPVTHINTFRGFAVKPWRDDTKCANILNALYLLCNSDDEIFRWLIRWLAYPLQNPGAKMDTAILCHSPVHGSGKSILFDVVMRSIYGEYARTVGQAQLEGNYNDWMSRALYAVYEEVFSRGQKYAHTGTTKQTITGLKIRIEKKFMSGWEETNHMNCVFLSNEIIPLPVEPWDRRFMVFWPEQTMYESFQCGVDSDLKNGGGEALFAFLLDYPMQFQNEPAPFNTHTKPPMTEAKRKLIEACKPIWEVFCDQWEAGRLELNDELLPFMPIRTGDLFFAFDRWCNQGKESGMGSHKFSTFVSSRDKTIRHLRDLDYMTPGRLKKATFFIPRETDAPTDKTKKEWLGGCVAEFQRLFGVKNG